MFYVNNEYGTGLKDVFIHNVKEKNGEIVFADAFAEGQTDFRSALTKIKILSPDAVYIPGYYKELSTLLRQARELGLDTQFLGCATFNEPELLELAGEAAEGVVFVRPYFDVLRKNPQIRKFFAEYATRFGIDAGTYAAHAYDAVRVLAHALDQGARTPEEIRRALLNTRDFPGVTGRTTFTVTGDCKKPVIVMTVARGRFVVRGYR